MSGSPDGSAEASLIDVLALSLPARVCHCTLLGDLVLGRWVGSSRITEWTYQEPTLQQLPHESVEPGVVLVLVHDHDHRLLIGQCLSCGSEGPEPAAAFDASPGKAARRRASNQSASSSRPTHKALCTAMSITRGSGE